MTNYFIQKEVSPLAAIYETNSAARKGANKLIMAFRVQDTRSIHGLFQCGGAYLNSEYRQCFDGKSQLKIYDRRSGEEVMCHKVDSSKIMAALRSFAVANRV